jgi:prepilin-type N-terminal cleavage/methylation domain-containing protein
MPYGPSTFYRPLTAQSGFTLIEALVALILLLIFITGYTIINSKNLIIQSTILRNSNMHSAAVFKAQELLKPDVIQRILAQIPPGQQQLGSLSPSQPQPGFVDELDLQGNPAAPGRGQLIRQWVVLNNKPTFGSQMVVVLVRDRYSPSIRRLYTKIRAERKSQILE